MKERIITLLFCVVLGASLLGGCGATTQETEISQETETTKTEKTDQEAANEVAALIDAIYVQERTENNR